jgi:ribonuclease HII
MGKSTYICGWEFERVAWDGGAQRVAGVDEVGRGPLFGPVVAAAVVLPGDFKLAGLTDSKKLSEAARTRFDEAIRAGALVWAIAEVDVATIDRINILQASRLAMRLAVEQLRPVADFLLIDGNKRIDWAGCGQRTIVKGDARSLSIAAASVVAKVHRDHRMRELAERYPGYGLERNMGYPTAEHRRALVRLGVTAEHRRSYRPVAEALTGAQGRLGFSSQGQE